MPQSTPKAAVLLEAAVKYLETELMPTLAGYHRFQTRVTANVLNTVRRELELRGAQADDEHARLVAAHNARDAYARERDCETYAAGKFTATGDWKNHGQFGGVVKGGRRDNHDRALFMTLGRTK